MDSELVQKDLNKNSDLDRATDIITKLTEQVDKCCPHCKELLKESLQN
jgi:hypothetical protein